MAKAGDSTDAAFNHSAARKQHKTLLGLGELDHFEGSAVLKVRTDGVLAGVALIDVGQGHFLDCLGQLADLIPILFFSRSGKQRKQVALRIDGKMSFRASIALRPVVAGPCAE